MHSIVRQIFSFCNLNETKKNSLKKSSKNTSVSELFKIYLVKISREKSKYIASMYVTAMIAVQSDRVKSSKSRFRLTVTQVTCTWVHTRSLNVIESQLTHPLSSIYPIKYNWYSIVTMPSSRVAMIVGMYPTWSVDQPSMIGFRWLIDPRVVRESAAENRDLDHDLYQNLISRSRRSPDRDQPDRMIRFGIRISKFWSDPGRIR